MNPLAAVESLAAGGTPQATLRALAEAVAALAAQSAEEGGAPAAEAGRGAATEAATHRQSASTATLATEAAQGRVTLGQLAAEPAALRPSAESAPAAAAQAAVLPDPAAGSAAAPALNTGAMALPVFVPSLQPPPAAPARTREAPRAQTPAGARCEDDAGSAHEEPGHADDDARAAADDDAPTELAPELLQALQRAGLPEVEAELARGRRIVAVQAARAPGLAPALAWLLDRRRALRFNARWWPGPGPDAADRARHWRVFRDGDPLLSRGLASRAGAVPCRLRLAARPEPVLDATSAVLEVADRIRFVQGLGAQWSLLVVALPGGAA